MSSIEWFAREVLGTVPYPLRMAAIRLAFPAAYARGQARRAGWTDEGYSFGPFLKRRSIFVHIPKVAGVSIVRSLFPSETGEGRLGPGHASMVDYRLWLTPAELDGFFKFTFVRNPWDRTYSAFRFLQQGGMNERDEAWARDHLGPYPDFDSFVRGWMSPKNVLDALHFRPQLRFLTVPFIQHPYVDFVGRFETLEEDYRYVRSRILGDESEAELIHANRTPSSDSHSYRDAYSDKAKAIVAEIYREDIEAFGYTFEGLAPPDGSSRFPGR